MNFIVEQNQFGWHSLQRLSPLSFTCGHCNHLVSSVHGYKLGHHNDGSGQQVGGVYICPHCAGPTSIDMADTRFPDVPFGSSVSNVPDEINKLYNEARKCTSSSCYTAAVLICRKILMHIGVEKGGDEGKGFVYYVDFLATEGFVPPNGRQWVDHIRKKSNEANHEIVEMSRDDAKDLIIFIEMLLKFIYEFPSMIPPVEENQ